MTSSFEKCGSAFEIVVVGASLGGLKALQFFLSGLSKGFQLPIVIVQHRGNDANSGLCEFLSRHCELPISEPDDKEPILKGHIYLAPHDYHLLVERGNFALSTEPPVAFARPSIDLMFESVADEYGAGVVGVILTGANSDGASGLASIKGQGGFALVQDPNEAEFPEMPRAAISATSVDRIAPLNEMVSLLEELVYRDAGQYASKRTN
jgi:two-component system chemotaxis response regulator CheB